MRLPDIFRATSTKRGRRRWFGSWDPVLNWILKFFGWQSFFSGFHLKLSSQPKKHRFFFLLPSCISVYGSKLQVFFFFFFLVCASLITFSLRRIQKRGLMASTAFFSTYSVCSDAAGIIGNLCALVLFLSPIPTFQRIIRSQSTEQFSGLPYVYALLNCLICLWYGLPVVSPGIILVFTVNSIGAVFQFTYIMIFVAYAERRKKWRMLGSLVAVFALFAIIAVVSIKIFEPPNRKLFVGYLSVFSLISMFASPLLIINLVIKTKSVEYMPFYLSLATFSMSLSFFVYGLFKQDPFISVPNGIGAVLGIIQLGMYFFYSRHPEALARRPLLESYV